MNPPLPDLLLARRAAAGQADAWEQIVDRHGRRIFNVAFQYAGSREEAEDLTQEVFLKVFRNLTAYRENVPFVAWILRLSRNLCIDHYRRCRRERRSSVVSEEILELEPGTDDPQANAVRREEIRAVYAAMEELSDLSAEIILLRDLQGWTEAETAAYLGVAPGTVKSRLHRARRELAQCLASSAIGRPVLQVLPC